MQDKGRDYGQNPALAVLGLHANACYCKKNFIKLRGLYGLHRDLQEEITVLCSAGKMIHFLEMNNFQAPWQLVKFSRQPLTCWYFVMPDCIVYSQSSVFRKALENNYNRT